MRDEPASGPNPHYYEDFTDLPLDCNGDAKMDIVTCNYFGKYVGWVEHPGDATKPWIEHEIDRPGPSECGQLVDINGDGRPDFLPNTVNTVVWYELTEQKPAVVWTKQELGSEHAGHGVGVGDINRTAGWTSSRPRAGTSSRATVRTIGRSTPSSNSARPASSSSAAISTAMS